MKKKILIASIFTTIITCAVYAVTIGVEPPAQYINNLKTCTKSTIKQNNGTAIEYTIKGKLPNGRCEVYISSYTDFSNPKVYEGFKTVAKSFAEMANDMGKDKSKQITDADIPTQAQMIEQGKKEKDEMICKFSESERKALINAYQKHDGKNPPAKIENDNISFSFDTSKMSSYDNLMMTFSDGVCQNPNDPNGKTKKYTCEYADTTCYVTKYEKGFSSFKCTNDRDISFKMMDTIEKHINQGMCEQIF